MLFISSPIFMLGPASNESRNWRIEKCWWLFRGEDSVHVGTSTTAGTRRRGWNMRISANTRLTNESTNRLTVRHTRALNCADLGAAEELPRVLRFVSDPQARL